MKKFARYTASLTVVLLFCLAGLLAPQALHGGGWFVLTLDELPTTLTAGEPTVLAFVVRHHGRHRGDVADARLVATHVESGREIVADAAAAGEPGAYAADVVFPLAGEWTWNWVLPSWAMTIPMPALAVAPSSAPAEDGGAIPRLLAWLRMILAPEPALASPALDADYGRDLFLAKGCVTCHAHTAYPDVFSVGIGPDLTHYQAAPDFMADWLRDPKALKPQTLMPNLDLTDSEIQALTAFLLQAE